MRQMRLVLGLLLAASVLSADAIIIDFESLSDSTPVTNQFPGLAFNDATVINAGVSLNEFEFPPYSGTNVVFDDSGPISIVFSFAQPVVSFGGFFTYQSPLTLEAFDNTSNQVDAVTSSFSSNLALSGDASSTPNELLQVAFAGGLSRVTITGDPAGRSFVLDDVTVKTAVPEPSGFLLALIAAVVLFGCRVRMLRQP